MRYPFSIGIIGASALLVVVLALMWVLAMAMPSPLDGSAAKPVIYLKDANDGSEVCIRLDKEHGDTLVAGIRHGVQIARSLELSSASALGTPRVDVAIDHEVLNAMAGRLEVILKLGIVNRCIVPVIVGE